MEEKNEEKKVTHQDKEPDNGQYPVDKYLWIVGAVILLVAGWFGIKTISSSFENYKVSLVMAPKDVTAGGLATFTWRVDGPPAVIPHTAVYLGQTSAPGELSKEVFPTDTKYNIALKDFDFGKYGIPLQFIGNIKLDAPGIYYYRIHAMVKDKNFWSDEYTLEVK